MQINDLFRVMDHVIAQNKRAIAAAGDNEMKLRRIMKRHYSHMLVIQKFIGRWIVENSTLNLMTRVKGEESRYKVGHFTGWLIHQMCGQGIQFEDQELQALFSIPREVWKQAKSKRKKPVDLPTILFEEKLSNEPFIEYANNAILTAYEARSKVLN